MATEKKKKKKTEQPAPTYQLFSFVKASREKRQMVEKKKQKMSLFISGKMRKDFDSYQN